MSKNKQGDPDAKPLNKLIGYFDSQVLASYRSEPDKYIIKTDFFEGHLSIADNYYRELEAAGKTDESVDIQFGYRTLPNGDLAVAAWLPDLFEKSKKHINKWTGFFIPNHKWATDYDERFNLWVRRYMEGDWDVDNGPRFYLGEVIRIINGLTAEVVGKFLFKHELSEMLQFPAAQNTHSYEDAHIEVYRYLIDNLDKECIPLISSRLGKCIKNISNKKSVRALKEILPGLNDTSHFCDAYDLVSEQRRRASHGVRKPPKRFPAFEQFTKDLRLCLAGLKELLSILEKEFGVNGEEATKRFEAKKWLPLIGRPAQSHYSICQATKMTDKTVERVEYGFREDIEGVHESEAVIIYFTDGSIMSMDSGSNAANLAGGRPDLKVEDFHVRLQLNWVPELPKRITTKS